MNDKPVIWFGIIVFLAIFTFPIWNARLKAAPVPEIQLPKDQKQCVASKEYMRSSHMQLLDEWRDSVVRSGNRVYVAADGKRYNMSLQNECMTCHNDKAKFCDQCHNYTGVAPYCWDCHVAPKEVK
ncbi:MAG: sulfate reduction electron transfer complex DsrMKJOP subunit DsrJ [Thermodesulfobacteriota bacterium]